MAPGRKGPPVGWSARRFAPGAFAPRVRRSCRRRARPARLTDWSTVPPLDLAKRNLGPSSAGGRKWSLLMGGGPLPCA
eukprot:8170759-Alexandrium_andersonii.AAC.1